MMRIRKRDYELDLDDIMQFAVWEYALDEEGIAGQDERTVRPYCTSLSLDPQEAYFIVRASFHLADGTQMKGYIKPVTLSGPKFMEPVIPVDLHPIVITDRGRVTFWYGASKPGLEEISKNYHTLDKESSEVFPIEFASDTEVLDSIVEGTLEGFLYCDESVQDFFKLKTTDIKVVK
jgi:hypothetical protein